MIGRHDRVGAGAGLEHMHGKAAHLQAKPDHADLRAHHLAAGRLGNEAGIGAVAALQGRERADAGTLLLDHGLKVNPRGRLQARGLDRIQRIERADGARLHVAGAAAIHLAVLHRRARTAASPTCRADRPAPRRNAPAGSAICRHCSADGKCRPRCAPWKNHARSGRSRADPSNPRRRYASRRPRSRARAGDRRSCPGTAPRRRGSRGSRQNRWWSPVGHQSRHRRRRGFFVAYRQSCGGSSREFAGHESGTLTRSQPPG